MIRFGLYGIILILFVFISEAQSQTLIVKSGEINSIEFLANSTLSNFEGKTSAVEGFIALDTTLYKNSRINLSVYLDSIDTGIGLRNKHMREKYLETDKFPVANYSGTIINVKHLSYSETEIETEGILKIHGIEKEYEISGKLFNYGKLYRVDAGFNVSLKDFNIEQPTFLFISVDDNIILKCVIYFTNKVN